jgi:hypothetical protein
MDKTETLPLLSETQVTPPVAELVTRFMHRTKCRVPAARLHPAQLESHCWTLGAVLLLSAQKEKQNALTSNSGVLQIAKLISIL